MGEQTKANAKRLMEWLEQRRRPAGIKEIRLAGLLDAQAASAAVGYAVRHDALERTMDPDGRRWLYSLTGRALPFERGAGEALSFEPLISAWGLPRTPLDLPVTSFRRVEAMC
jgi:hypothetical protein